MPFKLASLALVATAAFVNAAPAPANAPRAATQSLWGQCGGQGYSGATVCPTTATCSAQNQYYAQCVPGSGPTSTKASTTTTTVKASTTTTTKPTTTPSGTTSKGPSSTTSKPSTTSTGTPTTTTSKPSGSGIGYPSNPFSGYQQYWNSYYSSEVVSIAIPSLPSSLKAAASAVATTPSFFWLDTASKVPIMDTMLDDIAAKNAAGASPPFEGIFIVYDLPDRDCAAYSSNGEYSIANGGVANYKAYIDSIVKTLKAHSTTQVVLIIEPDSLGNLVTNLNVAKCSNAQSAYLECYNYALTNLNLPNVAMYIDAGHAGWLGWQSNIGPAAQLFASIYKNAGSPAAVRGLATNVANYNAWNIATCPSYTQGDPSCDEKQYVNALAPLLVQYGFPAHFITDTGRDGVQPTSQQAWGDWCNVKGTGFGARPGTNTGDVLEDAFVWAKPGGESDGTSNSTSPRYDSHCGLSDALQPAPEAGTWFQAYFQQLLQNANPSFT